MSSCLQGPSWFNTTRTALSLLHVLRCTARRVQRPVFRGSRERTGNQLCKTKSFIQTERSSYGFLISSLSTGFSFDLIRFGCQVSSHSSHMCRIKHLSNHVTFHSLLSSQLVCSQFRPTVCELPVGPHCWGLVGQQKLARSAYLIFFQACLMPVDAHK